jgi:diguanylate cyclase (GGDEF)-like protein
VGKLDLKKSNDKEITTYPMPHNEADRLEELKSYNIVDSFPEQEYDDIALLLAHICQTPIAMIALIDEKRKWHKSKIGLDKVFSPREFTICSHTIMREEILIVNDTLKHETFRHIGMVVKPPHVRFYAGVPLINANGFALGTLCVADTHPRELDTFQENSLRALARQVMALLELRRNISIIEKQKQDLLTLSSIDELSGLFNRRILNKQLTEELSRSQRYGEQFAVLMLDIDNFKTLNDKFGHAYGDKVIKRVSELLKKQTRTTDYCTRYGGDEFIVIMPNTDQEQSSYVGHRILQCIDDATGILDLSTVSIGIANIMQFDTSEDNILALADKCVYLAKRQGRNNVVSKFN